MSERGESPELYDEEEEQPQDQYPNDVVEGGADAIGEDDDEDDEYEVEDDEEDGDYEV